MRSQEVDADPYEVTRFLQVGKHLTDALAPKGGAIYLYLESARTPQCPAANVKTRRRKNLAPPGHVKRRNNRAVATTLFGGSDVP